MEGEVFFRPEYKDFIRVFRVETTGKDGKGKKIILSKPIYHIEYLLNYKKPFTTYFEEIQKMISFKRWLTLNQIK